MDQAFIGDLCLVQAYLPDRGQPGKVNQAVIAGGGFLQVDLDRLAIVVQADTGSQLLQRRDRLCLVLLQPLPGRRLGQAAAGDGKHEEK